MAITRNDVDSSKFNAKVKLPYQLRLKDFELAMQDVYDFFYDVNHTLLSKGLERLEDVIRPAILSGMLSDLLTAALGRHSRSLVPNQYHNGHPDLIVKGRHADNAVKEGTDGVEIKSTNKRGGAADTHGARNQWFCSFVYEIDRKTEPVTARNPLTFREIYLAKVAVADFRKNPRSELGTRTATLHAGGVKKLRAGWIYLDR